MNLLTTYSNDEIRKIIFEAYINPKYKKSKIELKDNTIFEHSNICVDDLKINLIWENDNLIEVEYEAVGCLIFLSSVDLFIEFVLNKSKSEIANILDQYFEMINLNDKSKTYCEIKKLQVFRNVKVHFNRLECASIIYRAFKKGIA
ncbi:iron-sulfur cluster assembly scaffold protein [Metamycoplasma hyosynoviae]|uniref:iron-sulfur cluster assembly scaffold protein n=1 Tax=Metamycoplasma hyosynoviae TaxID=29559 RepID=UPI00235923B0|nr:iron-sulfur cluster assembly scaffold protein [Metamycoplasma hyosynoviae]MDC8920211.1 iron-sulfur cluster assembly scaffold protein [Metamycoplasma hyosynoviae]MDD1366004.1 iron-sulfur cluster assembly scaffold protein [Metamycoplasma hyosynoviae]MDD7848398.1 iron-sulfur cluster assembly scaffold protein [Metamycoplasma hyosynoviae]MDD7895311.1 iron-sulfur cluster assembly scaffold protein [Metamycoplasma hyosynoviae]